ncbi:MAG: chloride channel protein [Verrucomicrobiota bacterium]
MAAELGIPAGFDLGLLMMFDCGCENLFQKLPMHWMWWPAIGAVFVGVGGVIELRVLGAGDDTIHSLVRGELLEGVVIGLLMAKAIGWAIALGSVTSGGVLAQLCSEGRAFLIRFQRPRCSL